MKTRGAALRRSRNNRMIAGVCGGLGEFFGVDPFWFRLGFLIALIPGIVFFSRSYSPRVFSMRVSGINQMSATNTYNASENAVFTNASTTASG